MKRCLFTILSAVSLLLCVATVVAWPTSYRRDFGVIGPLNWRTGVAGLDRGFLYGSYIFLPSDPRLEGFAGPIAGPRPSDRENCRYWGFGFTWMPRLKSACVPLWFVEFGLICSSVLLVGCAPPSLRLAGACKQCGYDMRATPGRCPECGAVPAGAVK